jgi:hypothetical protein
MSSDRAIHRLAPELWALVFWKTFPPHKELGAAVGFPLKFQPIILSHVCQRWREIALTTPRLWTRIEFFVDAKPSTWTPMLEHFSRHSGCYPLVIYVGLSRTYPVQRALLFTCQDMVDWNLLRSLLPRCRDIWIAGWIGAYVGHLLFPHDTAISLPVLKRFSLLSLGQPYTYVPGTIDAPNLDHLCVDHGEIAASMFPFPLRALKFLELYSDQHADTILRKHGSSISTCCLNWFSFMVPSQVEVVHLSKLEDLTLYVPRGFDLGELFAMVTCENLRYLRIYAYLGGSGTNYLAFLPTFPRLVGLTIHFLSIHPGCLSFLERHVMLQYLKIHCTGLAATSSILLVVSSLLHGVSGDNEEVICPALSMLRIVEDGADEAQVAPPIARLCEVRSGQGSRCASLKVVMLNIRDLDIES